MKNTFPGYCKKSDSEIREIWENGIIIFDTNVLLNLYRYSDSTRTTILDLIGKFSKQIYLPHQAGLEYNRNRYEVIAEQEKAYKEFLEKISQIQSDLQSTNKPPFLSNRIDKELNAVFKDVRSEVQESIQKYCDYLRDDPIYNTISELFRGRITAPFTNEELSEIYKEGEDRYKLKIPPGFEDEKSKDGNSKFGDLVLWKQVIEKAKELKKAVILITDERKVDWWWKIRDGRNMGPRQELVEEMKRHAGVDFHMYSSERFLSYGQSFLKEQINQKALEEIQAMKKAEMDHIRKLRINEINRGNSEIEVIEEIRFLSDKLEEINKRKLSLANHLEISLSEPIHAREMEKYVKNIHRETELELERHDLQNRIESLQTLLNEMRNSDFDHLMNQKRLRNYFSNDDDVFKL